MQKKWMLQKYNMDQSKDMLGVKYLQIGVLLSFGVDRAFELLMNQTASCTQAYNTFRANRRAINTPQKGSLVFFGNCEHIGIVMDVDENKIYTVEGNISGTTVLVANVGQVAQKEYSRNNRYIYISLRKT